MHRYTFLIPIYSKLSPILFVVSQEGPMIHSGAIVAAGVSQGRSRVFNKDFKVGLPRNILQWTFCVIISTSITPHNELLKNKN